MEHRELDIKNAYNKLLEFELELQKQEGLRENLGSPFGRAPPFKFNFSASASKLTSPNYASGMARHPFLSTFSTEDFSRTVKKTSSVRRMRLPKLVKVVNHAFQPSQALLAQISERNALKESLLHKFPSRAQDLIEEVLAKEESYETLYEVPSNKMGFNPFLRPNGKNYFFPLEMFYDDEVDLLALNYPQKAVGLYNLGETYEWKPCKVLKFIQETGKFFIQWDVNQTEKKPGLQGKGEKGIKGNKGEIKETSRHTVRFLFEDEDAFNKKIEQAKQFRVNYEAGIRYLARLEMETFKNLSQVFIPKIQLERIIRKIKSDINELTHEDIYDEIRNNYVRGVVEFTFKIQHFIGEAKRLEKPWQDELLTAENMQEKTRNFRHSDLSRVCKNLEKELLLTTENFALVRQAIHNLSEISGVRIYKILIDLSHKKTVHEDKKLKWVLKDWYSDVKLKVDKYVKGSIKILKQSESSLDKQFYMSQVMFESNLQVCIKKSTDDLIDHLKTYYAVLPFNGFDLEIFDHLSVSVMQTRQKMRTKLNLYKDHEVDFLIEKRLKEKSCKVNQFEAALECLSKILQRQIFSKNYSNYDSPAPLMILSIISRFSLAREVKGRKFKLFTIAKALEMKKDSLFATSLKKVAGSIFRENEISRIMDNTARTGRSSRKIPLLAESNIKWLDPNYEEGGLFIYPNLRFIEESLRDILKSPIKSFEKIKSISKQKMLDDKLFIANSGECYSQALSEILDILQFSLLGPHAILRVLSKFEYLVKDSPEKILEEIMISTSNNYKELHLAMKRIKRDSEEIENLLPTTMNFGLFQLELGKIKLEILNNSKELLLAILNEIEKEKCKLLDEAHCNFKLLIKKLVSPPTDVEEFVDIRDYLDKKGDIEDFRPIKNSLHVIEIITGIMHEFHFAKTGNIEERYWQTLSWPRELAEGQKKAKKTIEKLYPHFKMKIRENIEELNLNIDGIVKEITAFSGYSKLEEARDYAGRAKDIAEKLKKFQQESNKINTREHILKFDISDFSRIDKLIESFEKYEKLWQFIYDWNSKSNEWTNLAFRMIDSKQVEETLRYGFNLLNMIEMNCGSDTVLMSISLVMHTKLNLFEKFLPVIFCLRDESIELRHWKEIWNLIKDPIPSNLEREKMDRQTLQNLLDKDVLNKLMQISQIASRARHESEIEKTLKKIKSDLSMQVPTYTLEDFDRIELVTDINGLADIVREHILTLTFLQKNVRYISHCKSAIEQEKRKAIEIESFLEDFGKLQQNFKELFPLFLLPEIFDDLKSESNRIKEVQNFIEKKIEMIKVDISNYYLPDDYKQVLDVNESLDEIRKIMKQNLEKKQNNCSRLCFFGYESLIIFLTEFAKRKSLKISSLFPGIESIDISESKIQAVTRPGYIMTLARPVTLFLVNKPLTLDTWVIDLESALIQTFKENLIQTLECQEDSWMKQKDLQVLIVAQMLNFSQKAFEVGFRESHLKNLQRLVSFVREGNFHLEKLAVVMISQVKILEKLEEDGLNWDFTLKYVMGEELRVEVLHYSLEYCYEFHRMDDVSYIPTPISEKLMLHIVNSFAAYQPVMLTGCGTSGKTSAIKEIALICGKGLCFWTAVPGTSLDTLFSAVSGCASGGFWAVIEEIHNTEALVFSSLLYYMKEIVKGLKSKQNRIHLFEKFYKIKEGFSVFFTSSGKNEIPEFLTQNLRTLEVTRPDFLVLVQAKLQALGFDLTFADQIVLAFKLISENFESLVGENQRTSLTKSLSYLNKLISLLPQELTETNIVESFNKLFVSEVAGHEKKILNEILASVFSMSRYENQNDDKDSVIFGPGLAQSPEMKQQVRVILDMIKSTHKWVFIVGPPCSGKSTLLSLAGKEHGIQSKSSFLLHKLQNVSPEVIMRLVGLCERYEDLGNSYCSYPINKGEKPSPLDWVVIDSPLPLDWDTLNYITRGELYLNMARRVTVPKDMKFFVECENLQDFTPSDLRKYGIVSLSESGITAQDIFISKLSKLQDSEISKIFLNLFNTLVQAVFFSLSNPYFNYSLKVWTLQLWRILDKLVKEAKSLMSKKYDSLYTQINKTKSGAVLKKPLGSSTLADSIVIRDSYSPLEVDKKTEIIVNTIEFLNLSRNPPPINMKSMFESIFLFAVVSTFGFCEKDKQKFHKVILDFLSRQSEGFANGVRDKIKVKSILDICYIIETQQWVEWGEDVFNTQKNKVKRQLTLRKSTQAMIEATTRLIDSVYIQTPDTIRQVYWLTYYLNSSVSALVLGMHQSGKSMLTSLLLRKFLAKGYLSYLPISLTSNTSVSSIQNLICLSLEQVKRFYFAHVGGIKQYVYIDDLNLDTSNSFYELFRFWKENHGWYQKDFYFIGQTEFVGVHGFTANRPLYTRALRHFNVVYKEPYSNHDISKIFRSIIDSDSISMSQSRGQLLSNSEMVVEFYKKLFLKLSKIKTERVPYNFSLTTFVLALRKTTDLESLDNMENEEMLKQFTSVFKMYIAGQISRESQEIHEIVFTSYSGFFSEIMEDSGDDKKNYAESCLVDQSLFISASPEYVTLNPAILLKIIEKFDKDVESTRIKQFEELRNLKFLFNNPEETLGKYILFYLRLLFEMQDKKSASLCISKQQTGLVRSLAFVAAKTLEVPIFNFSPKDSRFKDFSSVSEAYLPIEAKFMLREVVLKAGIENKAGIVLIELPETVKDSYSMTVLEIFNDLFVGGALKNGASFKYYKDIIAKIKKEGTELKSVENDQVMVTTIERIKANVKVLIVVQGSVQVFSRFSLESSLETLKTRFRSLFNYSKILNFDDISIPSFMIESVIIQETVLEKWLSPKNRAFFTDYLKKFSEITGKSFDDTTIEKISFVAEEVRVKNDERISENIRSLEVACQRVHEIEAEISNFSKKEQSLEAELKKLKEEIIDLESQKAKIVGKLNNLNSSSYLPPFVQDFLEEKNAFLSKLAAAKLEFEESREGILNSRNEFSELASLQAPQPGLVISAAFLHFLTMPKSKWPSVLTLEALEPMAKPFINNLTFNFGVISKKIKKIQVETLQVLEEVLNSPFFSVHSNSKGLKQYKMLARFIESMQKYKKNLEEHSKIKYDWAKTEEILPEQTKQAILDASNLLCSQKVSIEQEIVKTDSQVQLLTKIKDNIEKKWKRILKMSQDLNQKNLKWVEEVKILKELRKQLAHDSLFVAVEVVSAYRYPNPIRTNLLEASSEVLTRRYPSFQGNPKFPSNSFSHLVSVKTNGRQYKGVHLLDKLGFFSSTVSGVMSVFQYSLPYPWIIDTYKVFMEFVNSIEEEVYDFTLETGFESRLEILMNEGRAAMIINPSPAHLLALHSLIQCRVNYYLFTSRGLNTENLEFRIANLNIKFNPKFRFYFCSEGVFAETQHLFSVFSMEFEGNDWKNMMFLKILKHIDTEFTLNKEDNYKNLYSHKDQTLFEEKEVVNKLQVSYEKDNPLGFFDFLDEVWNSLFINDSEVPKHQKNFLKEEGELFNMDCPQLLDALYKVHEILLSIKPLLGPFFISSRMYLDMVLDTIKDFYHTTTDINFSQMTASVDAIIYSLFSFICNSMPSKEATIFSYAFVIHKFSDLNPHLAKDSFLLLEETCKSEALSADQVFERLKSNFPSLLTEDFSLESIQKLETSDLYRTVKLPKTFRLPVKLFIYSKLRVDLLPIITSELLNDVLGTRYSFLPSPSFMRFDLHCEAKRPIFILYESGLPFRNIEEESSRFEVKEPNLKYSGSEKKDVAQTNFRELERSLNYEHRASNWIVLDKANVMSPTEVEFLSKAIINSIQNPRFRIFLIVHGNIQDFPHLLPLLNISYRICFKAAETVKERFQDWMKWMSKDHRLKETLKKTDLFRDHLSNNQNLFKAQRSKFKNRGKGVLRKDKNVRMFTNLIFNRMALIQTEEFVVDMPSALTYSMALFVGLTFLRCKFSQSRTLTYLDTFNIVDGLQGFISKKKKTEQIPVMLKIVEHFWPSEFVKFFEMITRGRTQNIEVDVGLDKLKYPLYLPNKREDVDELEDLVECMASEDHLKLVGLDHSAFKERRLRQGKAYLDCFPCILGLTEKKPLSENLEEKIISLKRLLPDKCEMVIINKDPILQAFWRHEIKDYENLLHDIHTTLHSIINYMTYSNSLLVEHEKIVFEALKLNQVPIIWVKKQPYCLKDVKNLHEWLLKLGKILVLKVDRNLNISFKPQRYFHLFIRNYKIKKIKLKAVFDPSGIEGLVIKNAKISEGLLIEDENDQELPSFNIELDDQERLSQSYIFFGESVSTTYISLKILQNENFSAVFCSTLDSKTCDLRLINVDLSPITLN